MQAPRSTPRRRAVPKGDPKRAVAFLRVSTDRQDVGPDAQRAAILAWAQGRGIEVVAWHVDKGVSGGAAYEDSPGLVAAVEDLRVQGAGVLVVAKRDRLARDMLRARFVEEQARRAGAEVLSAAGEGEGNDPAAILMRGLFDLLAEWEKATIAARTRAALRVKRARGERTGDVPYGYAATEGVRDPMTRRYVVPPKLQPVPAEQEVIALARELRASGLSLRGIGAELHARGHAPRRGGRWQAEQIARMLANRTKVG